MLFMPSAMVNRFLQGHPSGDWVDLGDTALDLKPLMPDLDLMIAARGIDDGPWQIYYAHIVPVLEAYAPLMCGSSKCLTPSCTFFFAMPTACKAMLLVPTAHSAVCMEAEATVSP